MRVLLACPALLCAACSASPPPPPAATVAPPPPTVPDAAPTAPALSTTAAPAPPPPTADDGPPPEPPMAMRWTFRLPPSHGQAWRTQRLEVVEDGTATWESEGAEGDADVDEGLSPAPSAAPEALRCRAHLGPILHRRLVEAARAAMASGCTARAAPVDGATTSLAVTWEGVIRSCTVARSGGGYAAFERVRSDARDAACRKR